MDIATLAKNLNDLENEINDLEMDMFASEKELKDKEKKKNKILNELLFYNDFEELYQDSKKYELEVKLLYPYKEAFDENGNLIFLRKDSEEYKEDVRNYLDSLNEAYKKGKIDLKTFKRLEKDAKELANKQLEKIEKEEKEQENEIDINDEYGTILDNIEETKRAFIINEVGEEYYGALSVHYKNMQEIDRKKLLRKTHEGLCKEMGIACDLDFTKYNIDDDKTVTREGYCIKTKDLNNMPYPLDTIILEQTYKLYISEILRKKEYTSKQKEELTRLLYASLDRQKKLVFERAKKKELNYYDS